jgi:hypothetical protein
MKQVLHSRRVMRSLPPLLLALAVIVPAVSGQDAAIDKLLGKLPPSEQLVKPEAQRAVQPMDPASKDPLVGDIFAAVKANNGGESS